MFDDFYGFRGRPFQLTPDPAFYFESLTHRKALSYLNYGLAQGEGFIVITGEVGAGKSTLVSHLMRTIDRQRLTAAQVVTSKLDGEELVHVVAHAFGQAMEGRDKVAALSAIERFLHEEARAGRRCLLVLDEAQNLSLDALEELRMLSNFQVGAQPLLQILLLGQPEFRDNLQDHPWLEQLRQRVIAAHHLDPMEPGEIEPYIVHRLKLVGWMGKPAFDAGLFADLYSASHGLPRRVNQIVNGLLLLGAVERRDRFDGPMLTQVLAELTSDGALPLARPVAPAVDQAEPPVAPLDLTAFEAELAKRDAQIAELQLAVIELANSHETLMPPAPDAAQAEAIKGLQERLASLEAQVIEQDRTLRHTLTMLIEWIERDESNRSAAA